MKATQPVFRRRSPSKQIVWAAVLTLACLQIGQASARTWRVELDGSGDYTVIQDAIEAAAAGDSILIGAGRFDQFRVVSFQAGGSAAVLMSPTTGPVTIVGAGRDSTIVGPAVATYQYLGEDTIGFIPEKGTPRTTVEDLTIEKTAWLGWLAMGATFRKCGFREGLNGVAIDDATGISFESCFFRGRIRDVNSYDAIAMFNGGQNDSLSVANCLFEWDGGILLDGCNLASISNTVFDDVYGPVIGYRSNAYIENCTMISPAGTPGVITMDSQSTIAIQGTRIGSGAFSSLILNGPPNELGMPDATRCWFESGSGVATIQIEEALQFQQCSIRNDGGSFGTVYVSGSSASDSRANFRNNFWGTTDSTQIAAWIHDGIDSPSTARIVDFMPFLDHAVPVARKSFGSFKSRFSPK